MIKKQKNYYFLLVSEIRRFRAAQLWVEPKHYVDLQNSLYPRGLKTKSPRGHRKKEFIGAEIHIHHSKSAIIVMLGDETRLQKPSRLQELFGSNENTASRW